MASLEDKIEALRALAAAGDAASLRKRLLTVFRGKSGILIERAARIVQEQHLPGFSDALVSAFDTLSDDGAKRDPGCGGKAACLNALDHLDHLDPDPFLRAARLQQLEKAWGPPVDTAGPVRSRAALALSRFPGPDARTLIGHLLADPLEGVRRAAIEALTGRSDGGGLLAFRWQQMDTDALVAQLECGVALIRAAGPLGVELVGARMSDSDEAIRETAALALAESRSSDALHFLVTALEGAFFPRERVPLIRAIAAHRSPAALRILDDILEDGSDADARAVLQARLELPLDPRDKASLLDRAAARRIRLPLT
jgi:HEAT repeat protein